MNGFVFLRPDVILFPNLEENALLVFKIKSSPFGMDLVLVRELFLPEASVHRAVVHISCVCAPNAFGQPLNDSSGPFRDNPDDAIIRFTIEIGKARFNFPGVQGEPFTFVIHRRALLALLSPSVLAVPFGDPHLLRENVMTSPWSEWGPKCTRWFTGLVPAQWAPFGQRLMPCQSPLFDPSSLRLFDFNTYTIRKLHDRIGDTDYRTPNGKTQRVVTAKSVLRGGWNSSFLDDVESEAAVL